MTKKYALIFDMDGVLFDTEVLYRDTWLALLAERGYAKNPQFPDALRGSGGEASYKIIRSFYPKIEAEVFYAEGMKRVKELTRHRLPLKAYVREFLTHLRARNIPLALASSTDRKTILQHLKQAELLPYFDHIVSGEEVANGKPAPDIFLKAAALLQKEAGNCFVCEDSYQGIQAAAAAGCHTLMIVDLCPPNDKTMRLSEKTFPSLKEAEEYVFKHYFSAGGEDVL